MSTGVTTIFFDGYETLFSGAMEKLHGMCSRIVREQDLDMSAMDFFKTWDLSFFPLLWGETFYTMRQAHLISLERTFKKLGRCVSFEHYVDGLFDVFADAPVYEDVKPALAGLESFRTGVISNADEDHLHIALKKTTCCFAWSSVPSPPAPTNRRRVSFTKPCA